jgi:hypothetical protein
MAAIGRRVRQHRKLLASLSQPLTRKARQQLLGKCGREPIICLVEILKNTLESRITLPRSRIVKLRPYAPKIRQIARLESVDKARRALIGGGRDYLNSIKHFFRFFSAKHINSTSLFDCWFAARKCYSQENIG